MGMMAIVLSGLVLWVIYGILKGDPIIIASNAVSLVLNVATILLSLKYRRQ